MDPEIGELKELVRRNIALSEETKKMVHALRNAARWNMVFRVLWWGVIIGITVATYAYLAPYLQGILGLYSSIGSGEFLRNFTPQ